MRGKAKVEVTISLARQLWGESVRQHTTPIEYACSTLSKQQGCESAWRFRIVRHNRKGVCVSDESTATDITYRCA